jgi:hypothetical protein
MEDTPVTQAQFSQVLSRLDALSNSRVHHHPPRPLLHSDVKQLGEFESTLTSGARLIKALKWAASTVVTVSVFSFAASQWWSNNATKDDLNARIEPVEIRVAAIELDIIPIRTGVATLVSDRNKLRELKLAERRLRTSEREFQKSLLNWKKRKRGPVPRPTTSHLRLIDDLLCLEGVNYVLIVVRAKLL